MSKIRLFFHRLSASFRGRRAEADLGREINAHLQLLEEKFVAEGMSPEEARFAAKRAFGNIEQTKELQRDARSFRWLTGWAMELRLGVRMLVRYPGLTVVGGLAMAFAILVGAGVFEVVKRATDPVLPLPDGEDIVGLTYWDRGRTFGSPRAPTTFSSGERSSQRSRTSALFGWWSETSPPNGGVAEPVMVAQISPAAFRMTRVPPLLGRTLVEADENLGSPAVVVLGHRLWQTRFGGDQAVVGRTVRLGDIRATVVGVMPEGFAFPVDDNLWTPLRSGELVREPGHDALKVFGRLAPGATLREAQAEAALVAARATASFPDRYAQLTPQVLPYANSIIWLPPDLFVQAGIHSINAFAVLLLIVICGNVALLMLTRTATREREILVRTALGATRGRILAQLVLEALVLATLAAGPWPDGDECVVEGGCGYAGRWAGTLAILAQCWAFTRDRGVRGSAHAPCRDHRGSGPGVEGHWARDVGSDRLRQSTAGGGGLRMGKVWTGLIVTQIAATVVFTATAYVVHRQAEYLASVETVFPTAKYLSVRLEMESEGAAEETADTIPARHRQSFAAAVRELERRLANEAAVAGVTVAEQLPLMATTNHRAIEVSGASPAEQSSRPKVGASAVAPNLFEVFQMPVLAGRTFDSRDLNENANTVVVNSLFVDRILGGRNAIGQRIRYESVEPTDDRRSPVEPGPWLEIVGVVRDLVPDDGAPLNLDNPARPRLYHCLEREPREQSSLSRRAREDRSAVAGTHAASHCRRCEPHAPASRHSAARPCGQRGYPFLARLRQRLYVGKRDRALPLVGGHLLRDVLHRFAAYSGNRSARGLGCASPTCHCQYLPQTAPPSRHGRCGRMRPVGRSGVRKERIGRSHGETGRAAPRVRNRRDGCMCARVHRTGSAGASGGPG